MTKPVHITLRVAADVRKQLAAAARTKGVTMQTFIVEAAKQAAGRVKAPRGKHGGVPGFFWAQCEMSRVSRGRGATYENAGYELARNLHDEYPYDIGQDAWYKELEDLRELVNAADVDGIWEWFRDHMPKAMALVPTRRKAVFVRGIQRADEDEIVNF